MACRMVASDSASSCGPHPNDQPPPPPAHEPNPTVVISSPLVPSGRVASAIVSPPGAAASFTDRARAGALCGDEPCLSNSGTAVPDPGHRLSQDDRATWGRNDLIREY